LLVRRHAEQLTLQSPPTGTVTVHCGSSSCQLLASASAADSEVRLYSDARGTDGQVRFDRHGASSVFDTDITQAGGPLTGDSLNCVSGAVPACLVSGDYPATADRRGRLAEVFVRRAGYWQLPGDAVPMYSSASAFTLVDAVDDEDPLVVGVQHD